MAFFKFRGRGPQGSDGRSASAVAPAESVEAMRRRARHRLLGAGVLVLLGIIGFPLLFDTQPRPVAVDIPIEIPDRNKVAPLTLPVVPPIAKANTSPDSTARDTRVAKASGAGDVITEAADGSEITTSKPVAEPAPRAAAQPERRPEPKPEFRPEPKPKPEVKVEPKSEPKPVAPKPNATATAADGARARALLDGKGSAAPSVATTTDDTKGRFVVQVGAFADPAKASEARQKLEKAGLKTYTHVTKTAEGERTRVRVGPFGTRAEADRAASRVKGLSMPAAILTL
jgi:DedD protein